MHSILGKSFTYKHAFALLVLVAFIAQTFSKSIIVLDYYIHPTEFIKNCINKDKPEMHCNGHCQMVKKLKAEEKKDQKNPERTFQHKNEIVFSEKSFLSDLFKSELNFTKVFYHQYASAKAAGISQSIFHPPSV